MTPTPLNLEKIKTVEMYALALISATISLNTLQGVELLAYNEGLLEEEEEELSKTICWEIKRLQSLYKKQLESVSERIPDYVEENLIEDLKKLFDKPKEKKKRKVKDE
jgi:hypothetical protein